MTFSQIIGWFIIVAAGATLFTTGHHDIGTANQAAQALAPLGGRIATVLFSLGIIGTGLIAVPTLVGGTAYGVAAIARTPAGMAERPSRSKVFSASVAAGIVVAAVFASSGMSPVGMLLLSALINGVLAGPMLIVVLLVANNRTIMAEYRNGWVLNVLVAAAAVIMGGASLWLGIGWVMARR
jgi:Mn2+/Fe2+ NRAMP family transporter